MALSEAQLAKCVDWCKSRKWQTLNRGKWKYIFHEKTLVRYVEEAKMDEEMVTCLLEYLTSADCMETLRLYGQDISPEWTPTRAWYEVSNKSVGNVRAVRLYHALATVPDAIDDGPYVIEDGCAYKVSLTYYWKRASVPDAPPSTSGVSYRVTSSQPDPDTGLFNYVIEKRERVQQDIPEYLMRTTLYEDQSEEVHLGVRGDLDAGGKQASVANGKTVTRKVTKNQDCTHDVHNTITQDKAVPESSVTVSVGVRGTSVTTENRNMPAPASTDGLGPGESVRNQKTDSKLWNQTIRRFLRESLTWLRESCRKTIFAHTHSETVNVKDKPSFDHVVEASNGHIVEKSVHKTEEGFDVTEQTTDELPVSNASESIHVGLEGTTISTTHRNQSAKAEPPTEIGETVTNERTQGGLWNQTIRRVAFAALRRLADTCSKTIFAHTHSQTNVQKDDPGFSHVEEAGGGVVRRKSVTRTEGGFRIEDGTTRELPVQNASKSVRVGIDGTTRSVTHRNQSSPAPDPTDIGEAVENVRTEGGLWNTTIRSLVKSALVKIGDACSKTIFQHSHSNTRVQGTDPGESDVLSASGGVIHERRVSRTSSGAYQINDSTTKELPVDNASESVAIGLGGKVRTTHHRNQPTKAPDPTDIGETVENQKTPGGLWNQTIKKRVLGSIIKLGENCRKTIFSHSHSKSTVQGDDPGFDHVAEAADGIIRDKRVSRTADGAYRVDETETTEKPVDKARETFNVGLSGLVRTETKRNQATPEPKPSAKDIGKKVENVKTEGGRFDVTISEIEPGQKVKTDESCRKTLTHHVHSKTEVQSDDPGFDHVAEAADGIIRDKRVSRTADGAYRVDETETTEKPVDKARKAKRMTLAGLVEEETNLYQNSKGDDNVQKVGESHSFEKTPGKGYNVTVVKKPTKGAGKIADSCSADRYLHRHVKTDNKLADGDPDAETSFEHGKITKKTKTLTALGTQNEVVEELTPKYHLDRTHWTDPVTGITYWTIKYRNAENEYKDFPSNAVNVVLNDTVNEFDLHDGILRYQIGRSYSASSTDLKFNKHGAAQVYYDVEHRRRTRVWSHRKWEVKARRIRGDMYTDYISELARANPERTSPGTLAVRLIEKYNDKDGNLLAEWVQVDLVQAEAWSVCTQGCVGKHEFAVVRWNMDHHFIINGLLQSI